MRANITHVGEARVGYCVQTDFGGDCENGSLGAWEHVKTLAACAERCLGCSRCRYVSFSRKFGDCSWASLCDKTLLEVPHAHPGSGKHYKTVEVKSSIPAAAAPHSGCRPLLGALWAERGGGIDRDAGVGEGCLHSRRRARAATADAPTVVVTSVGADAWAAAERDSFRDTILSSTVGAPLWLYHEASWQAARSRAHAAPPRAPSGTRDLCLIDVFAAVAPLAAAVHSGDSCIDAFYRIAGRHEPAEGNLRVQSAKVYVRSLAAIHHAVWALPRGSKVLWADFDVVPLKPLDGAFWSFVSSHDVTYAPVVDVAHIPTQMWRLERLARERGSALKRLTDLADPAWRAAASVVGLVVGRRTKLLLQVLLRHLDGGGAAMTRRCLCSATVPSSGGVGAPSLPCSVSWFNENLYFGSDYIWSLHLQWAARGQHPVVGQPMPNGSGGLAQGWFAMGEGRPHPGEWDCHATLNSVVAQAACVGANSAVSNFSLRAYLEHRFNRGPFAMTYSNWALHRRGKLGTIWPELRLPESTHGGWLHERVAARTARGPQAGQAASDDEGGGTPFEASALDVQLDGCALQLPSLEWV